jgi:hypothetical protein
VDLYWIETALEVIDLRSFSNLWFWIALAALWSSAAHWAVGVPFDLVRRAIRGDERAAYDVEALARIHARRLMHQAEVAGVLTVGLTFFTLAVLATLGFVYGIEPAQAVFLLLLPLSLLAWLNLRTARRVEEADLATLVRLLYRHRRIVQAVGVASILATAMWGMWVNVTASVL